VTEAERYLAKAREALASCAADLAAGRYNSAANRAYYAAFQATIAALASIGIEARGGDWSHRFVMQHFSVTLIRSRKVLPSRYRRRLDDVFAARLEADYTADPVAPRLAGAGATSARAIVDAAERVLRSRELREPAMEYGQKKTLDEESYRQTARARIQEIEETILSRFPDSTFEVHERTPKDYRMVVRGGFEDLLDIQDVLDGRTSDILVDDDIWIVVLAESNRQEAA
jgi:uncharacterized protein (UPF0332 family)